jgi:hypothetical protein
VLGVTYFPISSTFVSVGLATGGAARIYESNTAVSSWTHRSAGGGFIGDLYDVMYSVPHVTLIACGTDAAGALQTAAGSTWTNRTPPSGTSSLRKLATDGTTVVAVGGANSDVDGRVIKSTTGLAWTLAATIAGAGILKHIVWHPAHALWYAASDTNIWTSPNLTTWTSWGRTLPASHVLNGLVALEQCLGALHYNSIVTGESGRMVVTANGTDWFVGPSLQANGGGTGAAKVVPYWGATHAYAVWTSNLIGATYNQSAYAAVSLL